MNSPIDPKVLSICLNCWIFQELFSSFKVEEIQEMNLGANQLNSEVVRLQWKAENDNKSKNTPNKEESQGSKVTLNPMEIKTFVIKVSAINKWFVNNYIKKL